MAIDWKRRARRDVTLCARRRTWESRDGRYRVVESVSLYGLPTAFYAMRGPHTILGRHRTRKAATRRCERDARAGGARN